MNSGTAGTVVFAESAQEREWFWFLAGGTLVAKGGMPQIVAFMFDYGKFSTERRKEANRRGGRQ